MLEIIRSLLSKILIATETWFESKPYERTVDNQSEVDKRTSKLSLYQFNGCPFCIKVRRKIRSLNLKVELRDAKNNIGFKNELTQQGGQYQTPCLRIQNDDGSVQWMYESSDINNYLDRNFGGLP